MTCDRNMCYSQDYNGGGCETCSCNEENEMNTVMDPEVIEKTKIQLAKECMRAEVYEEYKHLKERDNPKKPVKEGKFYKCVCGAYVLYDDEIPNDHDKFCGVCGQRIDWGDLR